MVDKSNQEILKEWLQSDKLLTFQEFKRLNYPDYSRQPEQEEQIVKASNQEPVKTITNSTLSITDSPVQKRKIDHQNRERKTHCVRSKVTLSLIRKLEDYYIQRKITLSQAVYEILEQYFQEHQEYG